MELSFWYKSYPLRYDNFLKLFKSIEKKKCQKNVYSKILSGNFF